METLAKRLWSVVTLVMLVAGLYTLGVFTVLTVELLLGPVAKHSIVPYVMVLGIVNLWGYLDQGIYRRGD